MKYYNYKVRVLLDSVHTREIIIENLSYSDAVDRFLFYVHSCLEFNLKIRCVNIILANKTIKLFTNH